MTSGSRDSERQKCEQDCSDDGIWEVTGVLMPTMDDEPVTVESWACDEHLAVVSRSVQEQIGYSTVVVVEHPAPAAPSTDKSETGRPNPLADVLNADRMVSEMGWPGEQEVDWSRYEMAAIGLGRPIYCNPCNEELPIWQHSIMEPGLIPLDKILGEVRKHEAAKHDGCAVGDRPDGSS